MHPQRLVGEGVDDAFTAPPSRILIFRALLMRRSRVHKCWLAYAKP
jgi:hypothetical protein